MKDGSLSRDILSVTHICIICSISVVSGHVAGLLVISEKFKAILKIVLLGIAC